MKISITSQAGARLILTREDMSRFGLSIDSFDKNSTCSHIFISCIMAFLTELGFVRLDSSELVCSVTELSDGMMILIGSKPENDQTHSEIMLLFDSSAELKEFCRKFPEGLLSRLSDSELYKLGRRYYLVMSFCCDTQQLLSFPDFHSGTADRFAIQKIKEYARPLSHTPVETIRKLTDP